MPLLPVPKRSITDIAIDIVASGQSVLVPDTCILLDIIRSPALDGGEQIVKTALAIASAANQGLLGFRVVMPSIFADEWDANLEAVEKDAAKALTGHKRTSDICANLHWDILNKQVAFEDVTKMQVDSLLRQIAESIVSSAVTVERTAHIAELAMNRVIQRRPPAHEKGKQEAKDCLIFEEVLALSRALSKLSYKHDLVFVSSNKTEYGTGHDPLAEILADISAVGSLFASSLPTAYDLVSGHPHILAAYRTKYAVPTVKS